MSLPTLRALRSDARNWWYHAQLRAQGKIDEARKLERNCIRRDIKALRNGLCYVDTAYGGVHIFEKPVFHTYGTSLCHSETFSGMASVAKRLLPEAPSMMEAFARQDALVKEGRK